MFNIFQKNKLPVAENWHEELIPLCAKLLRPRVYVELGLYHCELFNKVIPYADMLIGIDRDKKCGSFMKKSEKTHFYHTSTQEYAKHLKKNPIMIDMLFIDANHKSSEVMRDFYAFFPFVSQQGIILLHDTYPKNKKYTHDNYCSDAYKAAAVLSKNSKLYESFTFPLHPGLTMIRKRKQQLPWSTTKK